MTFVRSLLVCLFIVLSKYSLVFARKDFSCNADELMCTGSQKCVPSNWKCDGDSDCDDGEDELNCPPTTCLPGYFKCRSGSCIKQSWVCDRFKDCVDNDDEAPTQQCNMTTCAIKDFQCRNGECIQAEFRCDREHDCSDQSDEHNCSAVVCKSTEFKCANNLTCVSLNMKCNGVNECADMSDEKDCPSSTKCHPLTQFTCSNGECHPWTYQCDGDKDCSDGSDEEGCSTPTRAPCPNDKFQCGNGDCIPLNWKCDGAYDCDNKSDELGCPPRCHVSQFTCVTSGKCISLHSQCDGVKDCDDNSDENNCDPLTCTGANRFRCGTTSNCIDESKVCNNLKECPGGEDEAFNCGIDECQDHNGHCLHICKDLPIGYECQCRHGYKLANDSKSCNDLDECKDVFGSCSQTCVNTKGTFKCSCVDGYREEFTNGSKTCRATGPEAYLVFCARHRIHNLTMSAKHYGNIATHLQAPSAIAYDLKNDQVYWSDIHSGKIQRSYSHGNGDVETLINKDVESNGLAIDWIGRKMYWTNERTGCIEVSELDGSNRLGLFCDSVDSPRGIDVDPFTKDIFWTDWSEVHPKIERASMDGSQLSRRIILDKDIVWPTALTLDTIIQRLYYAETKLLRIETVTYEGTGRKILISKGLAHPLGLAVFEDRLYYTDYSLQAIFTVNRRTGQSLGKLINNVRRPTGIRVIHPLLQKQVQTQCSKNNGGCSHLCLLSSISKKRYSCRCPQGMQLSDNGATCGRNGTQNTTSQILVTTILTTPSGVSSQFQTSTVSTFENGGGSISARGSQSSNPGPTIAGVTVGVIIFLFFIFAAIFYMRRRRRMADRSILFYKDSSTTPLQNDFEENIEKSHEDIAGISRVQFT